MVCVAVNGVYWIWPQCVEITKVTISSLFKQLLDVESFPVGAF